MLNNAKALINFHNVKNVTIDGSLNGTGNGRYLHFISGHSDTELTLPALDVLECSGLKIKNSIFESNGTFFNGESVGIQCEYTDTIEITGNLFKNIESSTTAAVGLPNSSLSITINKKGTVFIRKNEFTNFGKSGILFLHDPYYISGNLYIDSNHLYYNSSIQPVNERTAIDIQVLAKTVIKNNFIGGSAPYCAGKPWQFNLMPTSSDPTFKAIAVLASNDSATSIQNNTIQNIRLLNQGYNFIGIYGARGSIDMGNEKGNMIGSLSFDSSIVSLNNATGIYGNIAVYTNEDPSMRVENNVIAGMVASYIDGINFETRTASIKNNRIQNLTSTAFGLKGMKIWLGKGVIEGNLITHLVVHPVVPQWMFGMDVYATGALPNEVIIARNKISDLRSDWNDSFAPEWIIGLRTDNGQYNIQNNQISLTNGPSPGHVNITGILMQGQSGNVFRTKVLYNTVRIGGITTLDENSYALQLTGGGPMGLFRNNLLYNDRTGGAGKHLAFGDLSNPNPPLWFSGTGNNNLYVVADTAFLNEYRTSGIINLGQWRSLAKSDTASYAVNVTDVPVDSLFISPATDNLNIKTTSSKSWYVNGKALPIETISGDFDTREGVRSTTISTGATDIGADEFDTNSAPPLMAISGSHSPGGTENFIVNGRIIASITWGSAGTLPVLGNTRFYSGVWPNDTTNNNTSHFARFMNAYWNIPATGGNNYSYSITFHYDSSMLGKVTDATSMVINKKQSGVNGSWVVIEPTIVNTALMTITINNQTSFSEFTATDRDATLNSGASLPDLLVTNAGSNVTSAVTGSTITASFIEFNQGSADATPNKILFYLSADNTLTPGLNGDTLLGEYSLVVTIKKNTGTGLLTKNLIIPCNVSAGNYNLIFVADGTNMIPELNENNNLSSIPITISVTPGISPVITSTPAVIVCTPQTITLTANSPGCTTCNYSWNTGTNGKTITVNSSGTYTVTATNTNFCWQSSTSQQVTVNTTPHVNLSVSDDQVCLGDQINFTASGATTYNWSGQGLNAASGSVVAATPTAAGTFMYTVTGSSNGCSDTITRSVTVTDKPTVSIIQNDTSICTGSSIQLTANGASMYQWSPSAGLNVTNQAMVTASPVATTTYMVTGSNAQGCTATDNITLGVLPNVLPTVSINYTGCPSNTVNFTATAVNGGSNPAYQWLVNNVASGTGATFTLNNAVNNTVVSVVLTSTEICANPVTATATVTVNCVITALPDIDGLESYSIAPNPSRGVFEMRMKFSQLKKVSARVTDLNGRVVYELAPFNINGLGSKQIDISHLSSGIYFMRVMVGKQSFTEKLIKTN